MTRTASRARGLAGGLMAGALALLGGGAAWAVEAGATAAAGAGAASGAVAADPRERELFGVLDRFDAGQRAGALEALFQLTEKYPDFLAARLIQASLLRTESLAATLEELLGTRVAGPPGRPDNHHPVVQARGEAYARLAYWFDRPPPGYVPEVLIAAPPERAKVLVADAGRARLQLFERAHEGGGWTMRGDWYSSTGEDGTDKRREGDRRTPLGVYFVAMRLDDRQLPDLYGAGALGLNYPNDWDRRHRRTGYGIWIHGEPRDLKSRPPRWSNGCLTVSNPALETLMSELGDASAPVIIGERLRWLAPGEHERRRAEWTARVRALHRDADAGADTGAAGNAGADKGAGVSASASGNADAGTGANAEAKTEAEAEAVRSLGIYGYPLGPEERSEKDVVLVEFRTARADGGRWWQYWSENGDGVWRIVHEGPASFRKAHFKGLPRSMRAREVHAFTP